MAPLDAALRQPHDRRRGERQIDWVNTEQRRSLSDELVRLRYDSIDDLPDHKITHADENDSKYKCKTTWMTRLMFRLDAAVRNEVLKGRAEVDIAQKYIAFVRERAVRQREILAARMTPEDRANLERIAHEEGPKRLAEVIAERFWVPTTHDEIVYINQTLDALVRFLSADQRRTEPLSNAA
ncbi:MAG: hypothetical protein A2848_01015 [Candidatus Magasanikbacteria bacterium RIFCSPHIGHO2_01_FULL_50_8]|uniref:Uncharacterized protein n=2 Tax=Candidatus Magasanikiibacteriota TaxID=1752731 RepID=A0A1F6LS18_9BACT|nr:MAG: hypothetical protein A2848_01015 [Candidatus Magasanikbacteria bacterium RIFCSPHIGHO2_01_FULL_50_8]OGH67526.1 MAG: hypothetical protein A3C15_03755 [Candidatus Magasanikbacteria bacterium RIFCSPHIGHO2_02_FULL_50_9b]